MPVCKESKFLNLMEIKRISSWMGYNGKLSGCELLIYPSLNFTVFNF